MLELLKKSAMEQSKALKNKEISAVELTKASLERIKACLLYTSCHHLFIPRYYTKY